MCIRDSAYTERGRVFSIDDEPGRIAEDIPVYRVGGASAWVSIMYGCNNFCSYCIVPYVRCLLYTSPAHGTCTVRRRFS